MHKVSPSQLYMWKECPQSWKLAYVDGLRKRNNQKQFFEIGGYFHELAHVYYQALLHGTHKPGDQFLIDYMNSRIRRDLEQVSSESIDTIDTVSKMIRQYVSSWSPVLDKDIKVEQVEYNMQVPVTTPSGVEVILNCITDLIYRTKDGTLTIRDHKTGKAGSWSQNSLILDNQLLFNAACWYLLTGEYAYRVEISFINSYNYKTKEPSLTERFQKFVHTHNKHAIDFYIQELLRTIDRMVTEENPVRHYSKDCKNCGFQPICSQELRGFDTTSLIRAQYEKVDRDYEVRLKLGRDSKTAESSDKNTTDNKKSFTVHLNL